jgi:biopolymer transport protein ExbB
MSSKLLSETGLLDYIFGVWMQGGWVMFPLLIVTAYIYYQATDMIVHLNKARLKDNPLKIWLPWIKKPDTGKGYVGDVIRYVVASGYSPKTIVERVDNVKLKTIPDVNQRIVLLTAVVTTTPLMGLLGTVIGMLTTFKGLAGSSGQTVDLVASGISEALITTQTGLMVAIPGWIFISEIIRRRNQFVAFLAQVENYAIQEGQEVGKEKAA